jgi:uncharacterized membrane protein
MNNSNFLSLNWLDLGKAVLMVIIVAVLNWLQEAFIPSLNISPEIKVLIVTAIGYLIKNFFTPTNTDKLVGGRPDDRK